MITRFFLVKSKPGLIIFVWFILCIVLVDASNAQEVKRTLKRKVAIARFTNETKYAKGIFYYSQNPIEKQAADILATRLMATEKFILMERSDLEQIVDENAIKGQQSQLAGADYLIIGSVTEYGRATRGFNGLFSKSKTQRVNAAVSVRLVDVTTGQIIYADEAKGSAQTSTDQTLGMGQTAEFDMSLDDKAISAAISKLAENIWTKCLDRPWKSYFISVDEGLNIISGGTSQGIQVGDEFDVVEMGKKLQNPQTGLLIELPGTTVGRIKVETLGGETVDSEYAIVYFVDGRIESSQLNKYYIQERK